MNVTGFAGVVISSLGSPSTWARGSAISATDSTAFSDIITDNAPRGLRGGILLKKNSEYNRSSGAGGLVILTGSTSLTRP